MVYQDYNNQQQDYDDNEIYGDVTPNDTSNNYCAYMDPDMFLATSAAPSLSPVNVVEHDSSWYNSTLSSPVDLQLSYVDTLPPSPTESLSYSPYSDSLSQQPSPIEGAFDYYTPPNMQEIMASPFDYLFYASQPMMDEEAVCSQHYIHPSMGFPPIEEKQQQVMIDQHIENSHIPVPAATVISTNNTITSPSDTVPAPMTTSQRKCSTSSTGSTNNTARPYQCPLCVRAFARKHDLQRHIRVHTGAKPYPCLCCKKAFARTDALKRHLRMEEACRTSPEIQAMKCAGKRRYRNL